MPQLEDAAHHHLAAATHLPKNTQHMKSAVHAAAHAALVIRWHIAAVGLRLP
jgi:hypothetical protein